MAIHGTAFGGGLEVAMAGHYRVMAPSAQVGQPEVKLGIIPGAAGTQRLPRLAGVAKAVEMCAFGEPVGAREAHALGIADAIIEGDLLAGAIAFAREAAGQACIPRRANARRNCATPIRRSSSTRASRPQRRGAARRLRSPPSTRWKPPPGFPFDEGCAREAELFDRCLYSTAVQGADPCVLCRARRLQNPRRSAGDTPVYEIRRAAVIGAGTMGGGITMNYANAGIPVIVKETSQEALDRGMATIRKNYASSVKRGKLAQAEMDRAARR